MGLICRQIFIFYKEINIAGNTRERSNTILSDLDVPGAELAHNVSKCNAEVLKRWLECHSLKNPERRVNC